MKQLNYRQWWPVFFLWLQRKLNRKMVAVVIPVYKETPSPTELISLEQCCKILKNYPIVLAKPGSLNHSAYTQTGLHFNVQAFDDTYFKDVRGYNRLMLSKTFYQRFQNFRFILIHQLDAFVFKDDLFEWCRKGYDYIGAPWLDFENPGKDFAEKLQFARQAVKEYKDNKKQPASILPTDAQFYRKAGNGGFSLRRVKKLMKICETEKTMIDYYNQNSVHHFFNEDVFWSLEANRKNEQLKIPSYRQALQFAVEQRPRDAMRMNGGKLPFGCHAWNLFIDFWKPFLGKEGYNI